MISHRCKDKNAKTARKPFRLLQEEGNGSRTEGIKLNYLQHNNDANNQLHFFLMESGLPSELDLTREKASSIHPRDIKIVDKKSGQLFSIGDVLVSFLLHSWSRKAVSIALSQVWLALDKLHSTVSQEPLWVILQLFLKENRELSLKEIREKLNTWYVKTLGKPLSEYHIKSSNLRGKYVYVGYVRRLLNGLVTIGFLVENKKKGRDVVRGYILNPENKIVQTLFTLYNAYIESLHD